MKMKSEHYAVITAALDARGAENKEQRRTYRAAKLSDMRYRWDCFHAAQIAGDTSRWICDTLYPYLNDEHIDTALRAYFKQQFDGEARS